jgi:hypothetical protein
LWTKGEIGMVKSVSGSVRDTLKHYLKQIKSLFPVYGKYEKRFLMDFEKSIRDYLQNNSETAVEEAISHFGNPGDIIRDYIGNIDVDDLIKRVHIAKKVRIGVISVVLIVAIVAVMISVKHYYLHKNAQDSIASIVEVEIGEK